MQECDIDSQQLDLFTRSLWRHGLAGRYSTAVKNGYY
jgi:hypothetical protein